MKQDCILKGVDARGGAKFLFCGFKNSVKRSFKMKRTITIILTGVITFMLLLQNLSLAEIRGGVKVALNSAKLHGEDVEDFEDLLGAGLDSKLGFCFGGFVTFSMHEMFAIQPEVLYTMKGAKMEESIMGETLYVWVNLTYLEIPVLAKLQIPTQGGVKPSIFAGPALGIKLSGKIKAEYAGESEEEDIEDMKNTDLGLVIGGGIDFGLGKGMLIVDLRYTLGLSSISEFEDEDVKNGVFSLMVGISF
jgi:hypothetical protein